MILANRVGVGGGGKSKPQYRIFKEGSNEYRKGIRSGSIILDHKLTPTGFNGLENTDWKNIDSTPIVKLPDPDAIFDQRDGLNIIDSLKNETISVGNFPMANMKNGNGVVYPYYVLDTTGIATLNDWTIIVMYKMKYPASTTRFNAIEPHMSGVLGVGISNPEVSSWNPEVLTNLNSQITTLDYHTDGWTIIGIMGNSALNVTHKVFNRIYANGSYIGPNKVLLPIVGADPVKEIYMRNCFAFNRVLTNSELDFIRLNNIFPAGCDVIVLPFASVNDSLYNDQWDGVSRFVGSTTYEAGKHGWCGPGIGGLPVSLWSDRDSDITGAYMLDYGYTRKGVFTIPYRTSKSKGSHSNADDVEYPSTSVIHNLADSLLNFSSISDVTIKAIFDKSNRIYWKTSIESEIHYTDAGGGYYGLWHPTQLTREFIDIHAQTGHENHIFPSLRTSGYVVTGITTIRVYKTNITD